MLFPFYLQPKHINKYNFGAKNHVTSKAYFDCLPTNSNKNGFKMCEG
jgi:hypothetical protein